MKALPLPESIGLLPPAPPAAVLAAFETALGSDVELMLSRTSDLLGRRPINLEAALFILSLQSLMNACFSTALDNALPALKERLSAAHSVSDLVSRIHTHPCARRWPSAVQREGFLAMVVDIYVRSLRVGSQPHTTKMR